MEQKEKTILQIIRERSRIENLRMKRFDSTALGKQLNYNLAINYILVLTSVLFVFGFAIGIAMVHYSTLSVNLSFANNLIGFLTIAIAIFGIMFTVSILRYMLEYDKWYKRNYGN